MSLTLELSNEADFGSNHVAAITPLATGTPIQMTNPTNPENPSNPDEIKEIYRAWKLENVWKTLILPERDDVEAKTLEGYNCVLRMWKRLTENKSVGEITRQMIVDFRDALIHRPAKSGKKSKKRSTSTINSRMRELHVIISPLWPPDRINPAGLGLIPFFKWPKLLKVQKRLALSYSKEDLDELYNCCHVVKRKERVRGGGLNCPHLWQLALVLGLNCGARTWDLFKLTWSCIDFRCDEQFRYGSVIFEAKKTRKLHRVPLNECAYIHLKAAFEFAGNPENEVPVFPDFKKGSSFYKYWGRIVRAAKVSMPYGKACVFEDLRKTCITMHNTIIWKSGFWISGHVEQGVFGAYDDPSDRIFEAIYKFTNPDQFVNAAMAMKALLQPSEQSASELHSSMSS